MNTAKAQHCCPKKRIGIPQTVLLAVVLFAALLLTSCAALKQQAACTGSSRSTWHSWVSYNLPSCWEKQEPETDTLTLTNQDKTATMSFQLTPPAQSATQTFDLPSGETLYVTKSNPDDSDSDDILESVKILSFTLAGGDCTTPGTDYTWHKITFGLPRCWGAEESTTIGGHPQLTLYKKVDDHQYARVNFWEKSPLDEDYKKLDTLTLPGLNADEYLYSVADGSSENSYVFVFHTNPVWYVETNDPENTDASSILLNLSFAQ